MQSTSKKSLIKKKDKVEENWNVLFDQIVKGNVIPVDFRMCDVYKGKVNQSL